MRPTIPPVRRSGAMLGWPWLAFFALVVVVEIGIVVLAMLEVI